MHSEQTLIDCFREIESKHCGTLSPAESEQAKQGIVRRFQNLAGADDVQEFRCPMNNAWDSAVFHALANRYGIKPYRYRGQRKSTILVRASKRFMDEHLWPIFTEVCKELHAYFSSVTSALLPAIAPGPYRLAVLDHDHGSGELCPNCLQRLVEEG